MNKILHFIIFSLVALFFSCSENVSLRSSNENAFVSITGKLPVEKINTRSNISIPEGYTMRGIIEVWTMEANSSLKLRQEQIIESGTNPTFNFKIKPGDYKCLAWVDIISTSAEKSNVVVDDIEYEHYDDFIYDTSNLNAVFIKDGKYNMLFDSDICDAFYSNISLEKTEEAVEKVFEFNRPFTKLQFKENNTDNYAKINSLNVDIPLFKSFNIASGEPLTEIADVTYSKEINSQNNDQILFSVYGFTFSDEQKLGSMSFIFVTDEGNVNCEIPENTIPLKRNYQLLVSGDLFEGGTVEVDPEPEPIGDPEIGDFFFANGTWSKELTEQNKALCVGVVYATEALGGDNISNYTSEEGKEIKGYVVSLKGLTADFEITGDCGYNYNPPRLFLYNKTIFDDNSYWFTPSDNNDLISHDGYMRTKALLESEQFKAHNNDKSYPALQCFSNNTLPNITNNSSGWYIPSAAQSIYMIGSTYGFAGMSDVRLEPIVKNETLNAAINTAINMGIAEHIGYGTGQGYYMFHSTLNNQPSGAPEPIAIQVNGEGVISRIRYYDKYIGGIIRPVFTIIK